MSTKKTNNTPVKGKPFIKKGDLVMVVAGADKGKKGNVMEVFHARQRVIVEEVNIVKKHRKPTQNTPGGIVEIPAPIHVSNVMLLDPKSGNPVRVGRKVVDGKSVRFSKQSGEIIK
ncbi:MAG: 50S ribosomal protein L24 [Bacteroidota bacterium]|nr:50S ribosomal protein L24 [Bacteroidota bacterium]